MSVCPTTRRSLASRAAIAAGGHLVSDENAPGWWTLADAEGNEVDVASWPDRD
jgi:4a-hydroxytetrahydrobiopterin dehydratase